jgi:hypothetical protein
VSATTRVVGRDIGDDARIDEDRYLDDRGLQKRKCAASNLVRHQKQTEFTLAILIKTSTTLMPKVVRRCSHQRGAHWQ